MSKAKKEQSKCFW